MMTEQQAKALAKFLDGLYPDSGPYADAVKDTETEWVVDFEETIVKWPTEAIMELVKAGGIDPDDYERWFYKNFEPSYA